MSGVPVWRRHLRFWGADPAADVDDEFAFHVEMRVEELIAHGLPPREARDEALRGFGDIQRVKRSCTTLARERERAARRTQWWADWRHDVRYAVRQLRANPLLTGVLAMTIALGIGATVAVFSVLNAVILRPLPYTDSERIVFVYETWREFQRGNASVGHFHDWTEQARVFEETAATQGATYNLAAAEPERLRGMRVTPGYFRIVHVPPAHGRYFTKSDIEAGSRVAVLSHGLWQRRFAADSRVIGQTLTLNGEGYTVIGIMPPDHEIGTAGPDVFTPLVFSPGQRANYGSHAFPVLALLKAGVTLEAAQADLERVTRGIAERHPAAMEGRSVSVQPMRAILLGEFHRPLAILLSSVALVLLIACVNVANLLLARASTRRREIAIRSAIGGGRWRIIRQLLTESTALAVLGGAAGIGFAAGWIRLFVAFGPAELPRLRDAGLQPEVLAFSLGITLLTGLVFGMAPAFRAARQNLVATLREGGRSALPSVARDRVRGVLVVGEVALAVMLLVGAGLLIRSAVRLQRVPVGFDTTALVTGRIALPPDRYAADAVVGQTYARILEQLRAAPGVARAGASTGIPLTGGDIQAGMHAEGHTFTGHTVPSPEIRLVTDGYIEAIGMPLSRGRSLDAGDMAPGAPPVVLVNERLAAVTWPGENPIGKRVSTWTSPEQPFWREVVGVVGDVRSFGPAAEPVPELFIPYTQPPPEAWDPFERSMAIVARTRGEPGAHGATLRRAVTAVDPALPVFAVRTFDERLGALTNGARFSTWVLTLLAAAGVVLAAIGIYGVIAYFVAQRTPEIGLRLALGATPRSVIALVVGHAAVLAAAGIAVGLLASFAVSRTLDTLLFEITPTDPATYALGAGGLFVVAMIACAIPALRAVRIDPVRTLAES